MLFIVSAAAVCFAGYKNYNGVQPHSDSPMSSEEGRLKGVFSVSDSCKVIFSQGNLQYHAATNTWRFAEHQWDLIGMGYSLADYELNNIAGGTLADCSNIKIDSIYNGWIDLFGWGTGDAPTRSGMNDSGYSMFVDWGTNPISNGGNKSGIWRVLTKDEWVYLINTRAGARKKYGAAKVNGIAGVVILPDKWILPEGCSFKAGMTCTRIWYDWSLVARTNIYSAARWKKMEANGAVFLPAAGFRNGTSVYDAGARGYYWFSTAESIHYACYLRFYSYNLSPTSYDDRYHGFSVRLVSDR